MNKSAYAEAARPAIFAGCVVNALLFIPLASMTMFTGTSLLDDDVPWNVVAIVGCYAGLSYLCVLCSIVAWRLLKKRQPRTAAVVVFTPAILIAIAQVTFLFWLGSGQATF